MRVPFARKTASINLTVSPPFVQTVEIKGSSYISGKPIRACVDWKFSTFKYSLSLMSFLGLHLRYHTLNLFIICTWILPIPQHRIFLFIFCKLLDLGNLKSCRIHAWSIHDGGLARLLRLFRKISYWSFRMTNSKPLRWGCIEGMIHPISRRTFFFFKPPPQPRGCTRHPLWRCSTAWRILPLVGSSVKLGWSSYGMNFNPRGERTYSVRSPQVCQSKLHTGHIYHNHNKADLCNNLKKTHLNQLVRAHIRSLRNNNPLKKNRSY